MCASSTPHIPGFQVTQVSLTSSLSDSPLVLCADSLSFGREYSLSSMLLARPQRTNQAINRAETKPHSYFSERRTSIRELGYTSWLHRKHHSFHSTHIARSQLLRQLCISRFLPGFVRTSLDLGTVVPAHRGGFHSIIYDTDPASRQTALKESNSLAVHSSRCLIPAFI